MKHLYKVSDNSKAVHLLLINQHSQAINSCLSTPEVNLASSSLFSVLKGQEQIHRCLCNGKRAQYCKFYYTTKAESRSDTASV